MGARLKGLYFEFDDPEFLKEFIPQPDLDIARNGTSIVTLSLEHTRKAVAELVRCQEAHPIDPFAMDAEPATHPRDPFAT